MDKAAVHDLLVDNGERRVREVAMEILQRAGWM